jgi:polysaccharide biosynthesis protein PslH
MKKVLSLVWFKVYPTHFGGQKATALFNKYLAAHFEVNCLCSDNNVIVPGAGCNIIPALPANKLQFINPFTWKKIKQFFKKNHYSYLIIEFPYYGLLAAILKSTSTKFIIHTHNIEATRFRQLGNRFWKLLYYYENWCFRKADLILFKSDADKIFAIEQLRVSPAKCYTLPYGIEETVHVDKTAARIFLQNTYNILPEEKILLFAGTLDYQPNADAVECIYNVIEPLLKKEVLKYKIIICGRNVFHSYSYLKNLQNSNIIQAGFVEEIATYFAGADVFINPVQNLHGVQTKLFDALSFNLNVVVFKEAAVNLPAYVNEKVFVSSNGDYGEFSRKIVAATKMNSDTPGAFFTDYSWESIVKKFVNFLEKKFNSN